MGNNRDGVEVITAELRVLWKSHRRVVPFCTDGIAQQQVFVPRRLDRYFRSLKRGLVLGLSKVEGLVSSMLAGVRNSLSMFSIF